MDAELLLFISVGFVAQVVDGALGMAFGVIVTTALLSTGISPSAASAAVHTAEIATTGISGASHVWNKNVDRALFLKLVFTGVCGGIIGAYVSTGLSEEILKPILAVYLTCMALLIGARIAGWKLGWHPPAPLVGGGGGFFDAVGGGGWGPLVASTLIATGGDPRKAIGSVNLAEFFVTTCVSVAFVLQIDIASYGKIVLGLILGGAAAAPLGAFLLKRLPTRITMVLVAIIVAILSVVNIVRLFL